MNISDIRNMSDVEFASGFVPHDFVFLSEDADVEVQ